MERWNHLYIKGQAILELSIFGSIILMLLGILINYGLRYNYQQQVMQQAFRKALASTAGSMNAHTPISVAHSLTKDKHIPNPSDPFAVGSIMPVSSGASVTRSYKLMETPDYEDELPTTVIDIQGQLVSFKAAGFREEDNVSEESIKRYKEIYGDNIQGRSANAWVNLDALGESDKTCIKWGDEPDPFTGKPPCEEYSIKRIRFVDNCAGELMNYDGAVRQCRMIVDEEACVKSCEKGRQKGEAGDCAQICSQPMSVPWYCANYREVDASTHKYTFGVLNQLFAFAPDKQKSMGLQNDYIQKTSIGNRLEKRETNSGINTRDTLNWQVRTNRTIIYKPYGDTTTNTERKDMESNVSQNKTQEWQANW